MNITSSTDATNAQCVSVLSRRKLLHVLKGEKSDE